MKDILTNRTYQIIGGSALLVLLVFLYVVTAASDNEEAAVTTQVSDEVVETDIVKTQPTIEAQRTDVADKTIEDVEAKPAQQ
jgi:hypothetical protein